MTLLVAERDRYHPRHLHRYGARLARGSDSNETQRCLTVTTIAVAAVSWMQLIDLCLSWSSKC